MQYTIELFTASATDEVQLTTSFETRDLEAAKDEAMRILRAVQPTFHPEGVRLKDDTGAAVFVYILKHHES